MIMKSNHPFHKGSASNIPSLMPYSILQHQTIISVMCSMLCSKPWFTLKRMVLIFVLSIVSSCATGPKTIVITQDQLQTKLISKLREPIAIHPLLTLKIQHPLLTLDEANQRLRTSINVELISPLRKTPINVEMRLSGRLTYDASSSQLQLTQTELESFKVPELSKNSTLLSWVEQGVKSFHEQSFKTISLYQFKKDELMLGGQYYEPMTFSIKSTQLEVTLTPKQD